MQFDRKRLIALTMLLLMLLAEPTSAVSQESTALVASANGEGRLKIGREEFKITAAVTKLLEDGTAEITLITDISVFVSGTWSNSGDAQKSIDVVITGAATKGGLTGSGKLFLSADRKSIASLRFQAINKQTERQINVSFVGK
jgi:hypothetical protein